MADLPQRLGQGGKLNVFEQIVFRARLIEDEPALVTTDGSISYKSLTLSVEAAVEALATLELKRGELVLIDVRNFLFHTVLMIALGLRGIPTASLQLPIKTELTGVTPRLVLVDHAGDSYAGLRVQKIDEAWFSTAANRPDYAALLRLGSFASPDEIVRVAFTSGTTGHPKAVALRYGRLSARLEQVGFYIGALPGAERLLIMIGPAVLASYYAQLWQLARGGVWGLAQRPDEAINLARLFQFGCMALAPIQMQMILAALKGQPTIPSLRCIACGGSRISVSLMREAQSRLASTFVLGYGSTEAGMLSWGRSDMIENSNLSAGYLAPGVRMEAVDRDHHRLSYGQTGILRVKTEEMTEYLNASPDSFEMFHDGWFYPGDVGSVSEDGVVTVEGRTTDVINHGGHIIAPDAVEEALKGFPGVRDAAAFGVTNASGIEEIWAAVVTDAEFDVERGFGDLSMRLREKTPDRIIKVDRIPRSQYGKILRAELKASLTPKERAG